MTLLILTVLKDFAEIKYEKLHSIFLVLFVKALVLFVFKTICYIYHCNLSLRRKSMFK